MGELKQFNKYIAEDVIGLSEDVINLSDKDSNKNNDEEE